MNLLCGEGLPGSEGLDVDAGVQQLDVWAARALSETERHIHQFRNQPGEYENSEPYFRMLMLSTVLQQDFRVHYNPARIHDPNFRDSRDLFIHGLLSDSRAGTCVSMPVLSVAIGRRLGYPLKLAQTKQHVYVRWEHPNGEHSNFEATSHGLTMHPDSFYATWPEKLTRSEIAMGAFLRALSPTEELAIFLQARGHCQEDNGALPEAQVSYAHAHRLAPRLPYCLAFLAAAVNTELGGTVTSPSVSRRVPTMSRSPEQMVSFVRQLNARNQVATQQHKATPTSKPIPPMPPGVGVDR